ncbi:MAG: glycosyltransferase family 2 protein [Flavobacteriales bacterium]|nr:glycosyltransferase family 2 protein [Flavobacteriales bacterium]
MLLQPVGMALRISVIIPVFNAERTLADAVTSVLACPEVERIILVEDGSRDGSLAVCQALAGEHERVDLIRHPDGGNHGAGASRNLGLARAASAYVAFLDADDIYLPGRFAAEHRIFAERPDADGVYGAIGVRYLDETGRAQFEAFMDRELTTVAHEVPPEGLLNALLFVAGFGHFSLDALTLKRTALDRMPSWFATGLRLHQDTDLITRAAHHLRLYAGSIHSPVSLRGVHGANRITTNKDVTGTNIKLYEHLCAWAREQDLPTRVQEGLKEKYFMWRFRRAALHGGKWSVTKDLFRHRRLLGNYEIANTYFSLITGNGTWLTDRLVKLAIRTSRY